MRKSNYDKYPATAVSGDIAMGWEDILDRLSEEYASAQVWAVELYTGVHEAEVEAAFANSDREVLRTRDFMKPEAEVMELTRRFMTDDVLFGYISNVQLEEYFDQTKIGNLKYKTSAKYVVIGTGAALFVGKDAPVFYLDMARWEIQQRFRAHTVKALGVDNSAESPSLQYKRGFFNDWNICDRHKYSLGAAGRIAYWIDTNKAGEPKMISNVLMMEGLKKTARQPFRVVPFFDPAPWGGQWMKTVCGLDMEKINYGWCFDCVPEENSLYFNVDGVDFEMPSQNLVLFETRRLLGEAVESRFGKSFPIRFDFLDTMEGGNLSLQVHPTTQFVHENFGIHYTQDESYYLLDATDEAVVYLGLKEGIDKEQMIDDLRAAQKGNLVFDAEKYVNKFPAKKHDHYLIPGGTIHCSGQNSMVLEISSTPNLFTFKLWDWQRLGLDGKPRPINVERGRQVIDWGRDTEYARKHLCNRFSVIEETDDYVEERTGLHPNEFIETRRHTFTGKVFHKTDGSVNVLNLVDGDEAVITSPTNAFEPFVVHYAETFIIPASVEEYVIEPYGLSAGKRCMTLKAYVRI
uniref:Class I mannose-6-phosphate isomerase n=2 Tax=unclassified Prevotella TaxID=2638335 RepID=A0AB33IVU3_9BACT